ncbi:MAG: hypothetical protein ACQEP7_02855 [bacterium]
MRKKIFIIHGLGEKEGLGKESGGDLDTVASNTFYGAWMNTQVEGEATYGEDYEFDFVNYSEGMRHLDVHEGCDVYLPDFPIDALAPRLELNRVKREEEVPLRTEIYEEFEKIRNLFLSEPEVYPEEWKEAYNDLLKNLRKVKSERKFYEIKMAREYAGLLEPIARQIKEDGGASEAIDLLAEKLVGEEFESAREELKGIITSNLKRDIVGDMPQQFVEERLLISDSSSFDYGCKGRLDWREQLMGIWVEAVSAYVSTCFLISNVEDKLPDGARGDFAEWLQSIKDFVLEYNGELLDLLEKIHEANTENENVQKMLEHVRTVNSFWQKLSYDWILENYEPLENELLVQVTESESGRPVTDLEVVFNVSQGEVSLSPLQDPEKQVQSMAAQTDENGAARVVVNGAEEAQDFGVTATHNDIDFLTYPEDLKLGEKYLDEHPDPDSIELSLVEYLSEDSSSTRESINMDRFEDGDIIPARRAIELQCDLIEDDIRYLAENDVNLVRVDDHHPYTPPILERLKSLKEEGLIEAVNIASLPRGEDEPAEEQVCGADLIYDQFIKDKPADCPAMQRLQQEAHYQDLHIKESELAIEISKLIGSKYNKIEMVRGLMEAETESEMDNILSIQGWDKAVRKYEEGLDKVLPRVEKTLYNAQLIDPPEDGDYTTEVGWKKFMRPLEMIFGSQEQKEQVVKELYANNSDRAVDIYSAISPFCDPEKGEPNINVASALNYLTRRYQMDYYFYAYGSFLFSTRRVNEDGYTIDLSNLVSKIGSPSDGGHAAAATGSPENNPGFPRERFEKVSDTNFAEYLYYIFDIVTDVTGLELLKIEEQYPEELEPGMDQILNRLERGVYNLRLSSDEGMANICVAKGLYTDEDEPNLTMPLALAHLSQTYPFDYFFYCQSPAKLFLRNLTDSREMLDLDEIARGLGTFRDGGHQRAASCQPKFNAKFDRDSFPYINQKNFGNYVKYLGKRLVEEFDFDQYHVKAY